MKKIATVVGLGISGAGAAKLLNRKGWRVRVTEGVDNAEVRERARVLEELPNIEIELGRHTRDFVKGSNLVVASPGVKAMAMPLVWAQDFNIPVIDEIELGFRFCPAKIVAITGTNGKSTTTALIGEILKAGKKDAVVCGNIGVSFCEQVTALREDSIVVLEISSFQLQRTVRFRPYVSLFLNITENHLDRHRDFKEYLGAKLNIFKNQKRADWAILNCEEKNLIYIHRHIRPRILYFGEAVRASGACLKGGAICLVREGRQEEFVDSSDLLLKGSHNIKNAMAAVLVGDIFKVRHETIKEALRRFKGLEHRCEYVAKINGVKFINDSKATTVDATRAALHSISEPVILIAGGRDKGSDFTVLKGLIEEKVKALVLIGEARQKMRTQLLGYVKMEEADSLAEAVRRSYRLAERGETVLLSPMCASFDMFRNFQERGECFKRTVASLKTQMIADEKLVCNIQ